MKKIILFAACVVSLFLHGCASTASGKNQSVSVVTVFEGEQINEVSCTLSNDSGTWYVKTPGSVFIHKSSGDLSAICKKNNVQASGTFQSSTSGGAVAGNTAMLLIPIVGIVAYGVDAASGAMYNYPDTLNILFSENPDKKNK
jgi:type 1 fimbria pilin